MGILHIILGIIKVVGILLLILLGIFLLGILAILFCPVTYRAQGSRDADSYEGHVQIAWLFRFVSFIFSFGSKTESSFSICILGIPLNRNRKKRNKKVSEKRKISKEKIRSKTEESNLVETISKPKLSEQKESQQEATEESTEKTMDETEKKTDSVFQKLQEFFEQIPGIPKKILDVLKKISLTVHHICDKINQIKEFLESERFSRLKALFFQEGKRTICHIRPRKIKGHIKIGTGDPYRTGQLLAVAGIFFPVYGEHITIEPYFEQRILEGNISVKGRIYGSFFVRLVWKLLRNSDIRFMIKRIKRG